MTVEVEQLTLSWTESQEYKTPFTGHLLLLVSLFPETMTAYIFSKKEKAKEEIIKVKMVQKDTPFFHSTSLTYTDGKFKGQILTDYIQTSFYKCWESLQLLMV